MLALQGQSWQPVSYTGLSNGDKLQQYLELIGDNFMCWFKMKYSVSTSPLSQLI